MFIDLINDTHIGEREKEKTISIEHASCILLGFGVFFAISSFVSFVCFVKIMKDKYDVWTKREQKKYTRFSLIVINDN